jgi:hypothetical protein
MSTAMRDPKAEAAVLAHKAEGDARAMRRLASDTVLAFLEAL